MIKAIIFDFDGLIIDTETAWYHAYKEVFSQYGVNLPLEVWGACIGTTFDAFNPMDYLENESGRTVDRDLIRRETGKLHKQLMSGQSIRPGVLNYLETAKELGLSVGLATSSQRSWIDAYLSKFQLAEYFDSMITADDVSRVKPDPELYLRAMDSLRVSGEEAVAFEDSLNGLTAAKKAGAFCVIVPNPVTSFMPFQNYDMRLSSMDEMELPDVLARLG